MTEPATTERTPDPINDGASDVEAAFARGCIVETLYFVGAAGAATLHHVLEGEGIQAKGIERELSTLVRDGLVEIEPRTWTSPTDLLPPALYTLTSLGMHAAWMRLPDEVRVELCLRETWLERRQWQLSRV